MLNYFRRTSLCRLLFLVGGAVTYQSTLALAEPTQDAKQIFARLTSTVLTSSDPRLAEMASLISAGDALGAAKIASNDHNFYNVTLLQFAAPFSTADASPTAVFDDMQASAVGIIRDRLDFRTFLTGDSAYRGTTDLPLPAVGPNNAHYREIEENALALSQILVRVPRSDRRQIGIFGSQSFAHAYYEGGTNRRAVKYAIEHFLCKSITGWRQPNLPDDFVRRDVNRVPTGVVSEYQKECRGCHAPMDALSGAFAFADYNNGVTFGSTVNPKYGLHADVFPDGFVVRNGGWKNYLAGHQNSQFGFRGPDTGTSLEEFATMLANSRAYSACMVSRTVDVVCGRAANVGLRRSFLASLTDEFESTGYDLRSIFEKAAVSPSCQR